ncbi:MAG: phosphatidate cytidylyltransferase [Oscillospiraceae bacterium]|nr:phosphatidate cytidylyltransferase [Oscillospiraceae bacterium]
MKTRIISAVAGLVLLAAVLLLFETAVLDVAVAVLSVMAVYEMINAVGLSKNKALTAFCAAFAAFFSTEYYRATSSAEGFEEFFFGLALLIFVLADHKETKATDAAFAFMFTVLIPKAFSTILLFRSYGEPISYFLVMMSLAVAWLNDTCAYFSGYFFGKRKLCPEISPKKTVEGAIGGVFGDVIICALLAFVFTLITGYSVNWLSFVIFVPVGAIIAIFGDLCASIIKRQTGIKDYGNIMPGHGGIMDRFDSWIFVAPALYLWNLYFPFIG